MNKYSEKLLEAKRILGSFSLIGIVCGVSGNAVMKWVTAGKPPRTEYTGETRYAELISTAVGGKISKAELLPVISRRAGSVAEIDALRPHDLSLASSMPELRPADNRVDCL